MRVRRRRVRHFDVAFAYWACSFTNATTSNISGATVCRIRYALSSTGMSE